MRLHQTPQVINKTRGGILHFKTNRYEEHNDKPDNRKKKQYKFVRVALTGVEVETNSDGEDGDETEVNDGVYKNRCSACVHIPKFDDSTSRRNLKEKSRSQKHK